VSESNYNAVIMNLLNELRAVLRYGSISSNPIDAMEKALNIIDRITMAKSEFLQNVGGIDVSDRRYSLTLDISKDVNMKLAQLKNVIIQGKFALALNHELPEVETSLQTLLDSVSLVARGASISTLSTLVPSAQKVSVPIPSSIQLINPQAAQIYAYLMRVGRTDVETIMRELGLSLEDANKAINYLVANSYVETELSPERKIVVKLKQTGGSYGL